VEYRKLGRTGLEVGAIGLGTEHLERSPEVWDNVLHTIVEAGANYVDLLYIEPDYWAEFGPVLRPYRDKLVLAAHWGGGDHTSVDRSQHCFDNILSYLGNDYVEIAMMTMVDTEERWAGWAQESLARLQHYKEQGRIGYVGMSGHEESVAIKAVESGSIDVLMFPVNLVGHDDEKNRAVRQACVDQDVGLVAMKPYHGGTLLSVNGRPSGISPAQCLAYVFSQQVAIAVPGPRNVEELWATLHYLEASDEEIDYGPVATGLHQYLAGQCVYCHHCLPCPLGIEVGWIIFMVDYARHGVTDDLTNWYASHEVKASACIECGDCLARCPFDVDIMAKLEKAVSIFENR
jgi:predicted aldo/keto reductase-like oxidoreductase